MTDLLDAIANIPGGDGWWKQSSEEDFVEVANELIAFGIDEPKVIELLSKLFWAVSDEHGA